MSLSSACSCFPFNFLPADEKQTARAKASRPWARPQEPGEGDPRGRTITGLQAGGQRVACLDPACTGSGNRRKRPCFRAGLRAAETYTTRAGSDSTQLTPKQTGRLSTHLPLHQNSAAEATLASPLAASSTLTPARLAAGGPQQAGWVPRGPPNAWKIQIM